MSADTSNPTASPKPSPTPASSPPTQGTREPATQPPARQDETIPGGAYIVDGVVRDANGNERTDFKVSKDGRIVRA